MKKIIASVIIFGLLISGCADTKSRTKGVYMLLDTPETYALELKKAQSILQDWTMFSQSSRILHG